MSRHRREFRGTGRVSDGNFHRAVVFRERDVQELQ